MNIKSIKILDNILNRAKFKRYIELKCYDSDNNFYAKINKVNIVTDCELYSISLKDNNSILCCFFEYLPDLCVSSSGIRYYNGNISEMLHQENEKILERIRELTIENNLLDTQKQISINKKVRYLNILENIKDNKDYRYRKFKKTVNKKLTNVIDKLDSRYFEHYSLSDYELAIKDNNKVLNKIDKFIRRSRLDVQI